MTLNKIEEGSVKLFLEASQDGLKRIEALFKAGLLNEILGIPVQDMQHVDFEPTISSEILTHSIIRILLIDDRRQRPYDVFQELRRDFPNIEIEEITEQEALLQALSIDNFDLVVIDDQLPWSNALSVLRTIKDIYPERPAIMLITSDNEEIVAEALKAGLDDYVIKSPAYYLRTRVTVRNVLERAFAHERIKQVEQAVQDEAERANRIKDEFLAVLSHELRTPINAILGWVQLLKRNKFDEAQTAQALEIIERNAKLQAQLVEDLLDLSRITQGKISLNVSSVNLVTIISAALESVRLAAEAKSIQLQTEFEPNVAQIAGDVVRLQQIVWNLLSNAIKFTRPGGQVKVQLVQVNSHAQIKVIDTGEGISSDFLPHVFDSFRQADSGVLRKYAGLEVGLALVRHLVELHGGTVNAESPGERQGATFTVELPVYQASKKEQLFPTSDPITVLVADDHELTRMTLQMVLSCQKNIQVVGVASNSQEAIEMVERYRPDVVVLDLHMSKMGDLSAAAHIKNIAPNTQIIAYSSVEDTEFQETRELDSFDAFCPKDVPTTGLITLVRQLGQRANSQFGVA